MPDIKKVVGYDEVTDTTWSITPDGDLVVTLDGERDKAMQMAYDASDNLEYLGMAAAGASTAASVWQVIKFTWTSGNMTAKQWADGDRNYDNVWDNYASLTYS